MPGGERFEEGRGFQPPGAGHPAGDDFDFLASRKGRVRSASEVRGNGRDFNPYKEESNKHRASSGGGFKEGYRLEENKEQLKSRAADGIRELIGIYKNPKSERGILLNEALQHLTDGKTEDAINNIREVGRIQRERDDNSDKNEKYIRKEVERCLSGAMNLSDEQRLREGFSRGRSQPEGSDEIPESLRIGRGQTVEANEEASRGRSQSEVRGRGPSTEGSQFQSDEATRLYWESMYGSTYSEGSQLSPKLEGSRPSRPQSTSESGGNTERYQPDRDNRADQQLLGYEGREAPQTQRPVGEHTLAEVYAKIRENDKEVSKIAGDIRSGSENWPRNREALRKLARRQDALRRMIPPKIEETNPKGDKETLLE